MRVALTFPGQGSQQAGMADAVLDTEVGSALADVAEAEGCPLRAALAGDDEALRPTEVAQPALLLVGVALAAALPATVEVVGSAGHSVGEYTALVAAGALEAGAAMRLVVARGRAMAAMRAGTMVALLGADEALAVAVCTEASAAGAGIVVVANLNAPGQVVLSGDEAAVLAAVELARGRGVRRAMRLRVGGAFHSPLMGEAAGAFAASLASAAVGDARVPVACNVDGALVSDAAGLRERLRRQLTATVRWADSVRALAGLHPDILVELGPGGVLTGLARRITDAVPAAAVATPSDLERLLAAEAARG